MTDDIDEVVQRCRAWHAPGETITGDVQLYLDAADALERLKAERDKWYETFKSEMVDCADWKARAEAAEKERDEFKDRAHYAEGTAELAMKHRNEAEARAEAAEKERDDLLKANQLLHGFLTNEEARAEAAEKRIRELEEELDHDRY